MQQERRLTTATVLLTAGVLVLAYLVADVLLLVFAAVLIAVGLDGSGRMVSDRTPLSRGWAVVAICLAIVAVLALALGLTAARLVEQFRELGSEVMAFAERGQQWLSDIGILAIIEDVNDEDGGVAGIAGDVMGYAMTYGLSALGAVSSTIILIVLTIFLVANPALYRGGLMRLVPPRQRPMMDDTLASIAHALRWWFLGQMVSMALLGVSTGILLLVTGIDLWFALALLTAILTFIPFIGPLLATVPIVAVAFADGPQTGLIVLTGYIIIQNVEGNILVPIIQHRAVDVAPALLIAVQVLLTLAFGVVGLILAAPLTIVGMVAVQKLWVEYTLGEKIR